MTIAVIGAGVAGLCVAFELSQAGYSVSLFDRGDIPNADSCSWQAAGMLAADCEAAHSGDWLCEPAARASAWWQRHFPTQVNALGTLVLALPGDLAGLAEFESRLRHGERRALSNLDPRLAERFESGLWLADDAVLEPRRVLPALKQALSDAGVAIHAHRELSPEQADADVVVDCRGMAARDAWPRLRGVRGESVLLQSDDWQPRQLIRVLHPRHPLYLVPRPGRRILLGATSIESEDDSPVSLRSAWELLTTAHKLMPALAEARVLDMAVGVRPALPDNRPALRRDGHIWRLNGLYRHGYLLAPALAQDLRRHLSGEQPAGVSRHEPRAIRQEA